jgi:ABC-type methionine transport system permease subunit
MNNRIKMTDSKFKCNIFLFLSVTVFMARLSIVWGISIVKMVLNKLYSIILLIPFIIISLLMSPLLGTGLPYGLHITRTGHN